MPADPDRFRPETIARTSFGTSFRGFDQLEVRGWLNELAHELKLLHDRCAALEQRAVAAEERADSADTLDEGRLTELLGAETARVLQAAKDAAAEIRAKAEENVARMLREAQDEAGRLRLQAEADHVKRIDDAERGAADIRQAAEAERLKVLDDAAAELESARSEGRSMVEEAQALRARVLDDLSRRRKQARQQIEQLRAGRQRLLDAYDVVRESLDDVTHELRVAWPEAKQAAETAGRRPLDDDEPDEFAPAEPAAAELAATEPEAAPTAETAPAVVDLTATAPAVDEPIEPLTLPPPDQRGGRRRRAPAVARELPDAQLMPLRREEEFEDVRVVEPADAPVNGDESDDSPEAGARVEELFARIRASRADDVAKAREVLASVEPDAAGNGAAPPSAAEDTAVVEETPSAEAEEAAAAEPVEPTEPADPAAAARLSLLERRDAATDVVEARLARRLKRTLADEQNEVLDGLRRARNGRPADALPAVSVQSARYARSASADLKAAATSGLEFFGEGKAAEIDVDDLAGELAEMIVGMLRERIERSLRESAADTDSDEIAEQIRACYREWKTQRIGDTARHFVLAAFNRGVYAAHPDGVAMCWVVDNGGTPCPDADDNALAGPTPKGTAFPTGHNLPPAHPGCRCLIVPADALP